MAMLDSLLTCLDIACVPPPPMMILAAPAFALAALFSHTQAKHRACSWHDKGITDPISHGYSPFCTARRNDIVGPDHSEYKCLENKGIVVADYGFLRNDVLEYRTPHGHGGYDSDSQIKYYGVCIGDNTTEEGKQLHFEVSRVRCVAAELS